MNDPQTLHRAIPQENKGVPADKVTESRLDMAMYPLRSPLFGPTQRVGLFRAKIDGLVPHAYLVKLRLVRQAFVAS